MIRFENVRGGEVEYVRYLLDPSNSDVMILEFASGTQTSLVEVPDDCGCPGGSDDDFELPIEEDLFAALRFELQKDETLVAQPLLLPFISVNKVQVLGGPAELDETGRVGIRVDQNGVPAPEAALSFENTVALVASELEDGVTTSQTTFTWAVSRSPGKVNWHCWAPHSAGPVPSSMRPAAAPILRCWPPSITALSTTTRNTTGLFSLDVATMC